MENKDLNKILLIKKIKLIASIIGIIIGLICIAVVNINAALITLATIAITSSVYTLYNLDKLE